jgi:hemoglobin
VLPDLDSPAAIDRFVDAFYARVLADPLLAPLFLDVAGIELQAHLPRIKAYWAKMLLGDAAYRRHMMARHRAVHRRSRFTDAHYERWLALFELTLSEQASGPVSERAGELARRIAGNMRRNLQQFAADSAEAFEI